MYSLKAYRIANKINPITSFQIIGSQLANIKNIPYKIHKIYRVEVVGLQSFSYALKLL